MRMQQLFGINVLLIPKVGAVNLSGKSQRRLVAHRTATGYCKTIKIIQRQALGRRLQITLGEKKINCDVLLENTDNFHVSFATLVGLHFTPVTHSFVQ